MFACMHVQMCLFGNSLNRIDGGAEGRTRVSLGAAAQAHAARPPMHVMLPDLLQDLARSAAAGAWLAPACPVHLFSRVTLRGV